MAKISMQQKQALLTNRVLEQQASEDKRKGARLVTLKKRIQVVNYIVNYGVDKSTCLTTQEKLQHAWCISLQHIGHLGYHTNIVHKYNLSMLLTQVPCSSTSTLYLDQTYQLYLTTSLQEYLFLCLVDAHGKTPLLGFHQVPLDPGQIELLQTFCEDDPYDYPMI